MLGMQKMYDSDDDFEPSTAQKALIAKQAAELQDYDVPDTKTAAAPKSQPDTKTVATAGEQHHASAIAAGAAAKQQTDIEVVATAEEEQPGNSASDAAAKQQPGSASAAEAASLPQHSASLPADKAAAPVLGTAAVTPSGTAAKAGTAAKSGTAEASASVSREAKSTAQNGKSTGKSTDKSTDKSRDKSTLKRIPNSPVHRSTQELHSSPAAAAASAAPSAAAAEASGVFDGGSPKRKDHIWQPPQGMTSPSCSQHSPGNHGRQNASKPQRQGDSPLKPLVDKALLSRKRKSAPADTDAAAATSQEPRHKQVGACNVSSNATAQLKRIYKWSERFPNELFRYLYAQEDFAYDGFFDWTIT